MFDKTREQQIIALCQDLIRIESYSGKEGTLAEKLAQTFRGLGYDHVYTDEYGNIIGHIQGSRPGKTLLLDGHIDTVPAEDGGGWSFDPFGGEIADDKIYGRGASDMKGAISAMVNGAGYFALDTNKEFPGDIYVAGIVHEECFEGIAARKVSESFKPDYVIIGEATSLKINRGQRGRAEIVIETYGQPAHSSNPKAGINAVYKMNKLIEGISQIKVPMSTELGEGILELTDIKSTPYPGSSVVPEYCRATYDRRLLLGETKEWVLQPIIDLIKRLETADPDFKAVVSYARSEEKTYNGNLIYGERFFPAWLLSEDDDFLKQALAGISRAGLKPELSCYSFCTNGSHYAGEAGIKTIGFGPSHEHLAHTINEYIEIDQLLKACSGYYQIIKSVLMG